MKNYILYLSLTLILSCTYSEKYFISSPVGDNRLKFEWKNSLNPNNKGHIKISLTNRGKSFVAIRPILDFPIHIYWGDTIKIRGGILIDADTNNRILNWRRDYTKQEELQVKSDTIKWKHYYLSKIPEGYYK